MKLLRHCWLLLFGLPTSLWATCTTNLPGNAPAVYTFSAPPAIFDPTVPIGTVVYSSILPIQPVTNVLMTCSPSAMTIVYRGTQGTQGAYNTYSTPIAGVGYRISFADWIPGPPGWWPFTAVGDAYGWSSMNTNASYSSYSMILQLVKTGPITAGGALSGEVGGTYMDGSYQLMSLQVAGVIPIEPQVPSCTVTTPTLTVPLGTVPANTFTTIGSVSAATPPFNIQLQCSGGEAGTVTNVYMTLTDAANPGNTSNVLPLTPGSLAASGVGIQVLNGSTVLGFGPDASTAGNTNKWLVQGSMGNGTLNIPLSARYIKTADTVTPGQANSVATFTMSYQ